MNGPAIEEGFYYDVDIDKAISEEDFSKIEKEMIRLVNKNLRFEKEMKSKEELLEFYKENECKKYFIEKNVEKETSIYRNENFFDMCFGTTHSLN